MSHKKRKLSSTLMIKDEARFRQVERCLNRCCDQLDVLNEKTKTLKKRYVTAKEEGHKSLAYLLHMELCTLEGVRGMFYEYASRKAEELAQLSQSINESRNEEMEGIYELQL